MGRFEKREGFCGGESGAAAALELNWRREVGAIGDRYLRVSF
jgi:hypothetical protein